MKIFFFFLLTQCVLFTSISAQDKNSKIDDNFSNNKLNKPTAAGNVIQFKNETSNPIIIITDEGSNIGSITLPSGSAPSTTTNKLYNVGGTLNFNGTALGSGGASAINDLSDANFDGSSLFIGEGSGTNNAGSFNTAAGKNSLFSNTTGERNTANGYSALYANTTGNYNTANGTFALLSNTTGDVNTANGFNALYNNTTGSNNTAIGVRALGLNVAGSNGVAVGYESQLYANNTLTEYDNYNTSVGYQSLRGSITSSSNIGNNNSAFGYQSLYSNSTGNNNTANGYYALYSNTTGNNNTANGYYALYSNTEGYGNSANGRHALFSNTSGSNNTANGYNALYSNTLGSNNTAIGFSAGSDFAITGSNLTCIGYNAEPTSAIATNQITLGDNQVQSLRCNVQSITSLSDVRDKKNITDLALGLDFLMKIKPRQFNWDKREWYESNMSNGSNMMGKPTAGFIAQELDEAQTAANAEWLNLVLKDNPDKLEATYGNLLPVMVKAIQDQQKIIANLQQQNLEVCSKNLELENRLTKLESFFEGKKFAELKK